MAVVVVEAAAVAVVDSSAVDFAVVGFAYPVVGFAYPVVDFAYRVVDFAYRVVAFDFVSPSGPDPFDLDAFDYGDQLHFDLHLKQRNKYAMISFCFLKFKLKFLKVSRSQNKIVEP